MAAQRSDHTGTILAIGGVWLAVSLIGDLFRGVAGLWGGGLTSEEAAFIELRKKIVALYNRIDPAGVYVDATQAQRQAIVENKQRLEAIANAIAGAPGFINDNEAVTLAAIRQVRSFYELLWVNRFFVGAPDVRSLGVFDFSLGVPNIGDYMDAYCQPREWLAIMQQIENLPKY